MRSATTIPFFHRRVVFQRKGCGLTYSPASVSSQRVEICPSRSMTVCSTRRDSTLAIDWSHRLRGAEAGRGEVIGPTGSEFYSGRADFPRGGPFLKPVVRTNSFSRAAAASGALFSPVALTLRSKRILIRLRRSAAILRAGGAGDYSESRTINIGGGANGY